MNKTRIENCIRKLRFEHGEMTQQDLAERVGVTRQTINAIELGKYSPSLEVAFKISRVFGRALEEVFGWPEAVEGAAREDAGGDPKSGQAADDETSDDGAVGDPAQSVSR